MESVVAAHELIHEVAKQNEQGIILKLDYEKAYDRVDWGFLEEVMQTRDFSEKWMKWIRRVTRGGSVFVRINDTNSSYFSMGKGLRQGYLFSPLLFNLVADVFTRMLIKATDQDLIEGLVPEVQTGGVISLQYADDTLLFLKNDPHKARHFKYLLSCFEQLSGMKINYNKNDLLTLGLSEEEKNNYARLFFCNIGTFPLKIPGSPSTLHQAEKGAYPASCRQTYWENSWLEREITFQCW